MPDEMKMLPCPFCGSDADISAVSSDDDPHCFICGFSVFRETWNTRPIEDTLRAENARLKAQIAEAQKGSITLSEVLIADAYQIEIDQLKARLEAAEALLSDVYDNTGSKIETACPVCMTYTHKHWCWYPALLKFLGKDMDKHDAVFLEKTGGNLEADNA